MSSSGSLPTLLHEAADELLRVLLQHLVDLVKNRVDVLVEPFLALGDVFLRLDLLDLFLAGRPLRLLVLLPAVFRHGTPPRTAVESRPTDSLMRPYPAAPPVMVRTRSLAVSHWSSKAPTCALVPRKGSSVGIRCKDSLPGRSKITESQEAAAT